MAIMIPKLAREAPPESKEHFIFQQLQQNLSDDYYVFHALAYHLGEGHEDIYGEIDFTIYHPEKGILVIEAKAGRISYQQGQWCYEGGNRMKTGGPFVQSERNKYNLMKRFDTPDLQRLRDRCPILSAVCLPSYGRADIASVALPPEAHKDFILTADELENPNDFIAHIFARGASRIAVQGVWGAHDHSRILNEILCPEFNIIPTYRIEDQIKKQVFVRLLREQMMVLDFLEEQPSVAIHGAAGTGKTLVAVEKARRLARTELRGKKILFLCYNKLLKQKLREEYRHWSIDYYTLDALKTKLCGTDASYEDLNYRLLELEEKQQFPYQHVIIDEGQDFGEPRGDTLDCLRDIVCSSRRDGRFYIFYDKNQLVQGRSLPSCIESADCKLGLYRNCRNTVKIATTTQRILGSEGQSMTRFMDRTLKGESVKIAIDPDEATIVQRVNQIIAKHREQDHAPDSIAILTCCTEAQSVLRQQVVEGLYQGVPFHTCRRFKGLEADTIILLDGDLRILCEPPSNASADSTHEAEHRRLFYVGGSRARHQLYILAMLGDEECRELPEIRNNGSLVKVKSRIAARFAATLFS